MKLKVLGICALIVGYAWFVFGETAGLVAAGVIFVALTTLSVVLFVGGSSIGRMK